MTWLFLRSANEKALSEQERQDLAATLAVRPSLSTLKDLIHEFLRLVRQHDAQALTPWLESATASTFGSMKRLAAGLQSDVAAVRAALEQPWSNGQVEGQVNRLKFMKRSMYGRGSFDLLKARVLHQSA